MSSRDVKESDQDAAWGWKEIKRLFAELDRLPDLTAISIEPGSPLDADGQIENYDKPSDQVIFLLGVARDHLDAFQRMLVDESGGLPAMAGYTLMRAAIESAAKAV